MHNTLLLPLNPLQLRRVTERVMPELAPKVDERDSLLEQIRTKVRVCNSFLYADGTLFIFKAFLYLKLLFGTPSPST